MFLCDFLHLMWSDCKKAEIIMPPCVWLQKKKKKKKKTRHINMCFPHDL